MAKETLPRSESFDLDKFYGELEIARRDLVAKDGDRERGKATLIELFEKGVGQEVRLSAEADIVIEGGQLRALERPVELIDKWLLIKGTNDHGPIVRETEDGEDRIDLVLIPSSIDPFPTLADFI